MAQMLPPYVGEKTKSDAERRLFGKIERDLSDEWVVLHSLGLGDHPRKPWAEIDFVLIGPQGVFCIEVKGGRVSREAGMWRFTDREGRSNDKAEGPFEQVGSASAALAKRIHARAPLRGVMVGYGVATPDIDFRIQGPDVVSEVVFDASHAHEPFLRYVDQLSTYWAARLPGARRPTAHDREVLLNLLRGDFDLRPSLRHRVGLVSDELVGLTEKQYEVLDGLEDNPRALIRGGAGTGKTLLAIEEASRLASRGYSVLMCCYNRALGQYLKAATADQEKIRAVSLHAYMYELIDRAGLVNRLSAGSDDDLYGVTYPQLALEALLSRADAPTFDVLILDEAQDVLRVDYVDVFDVLLKEGLRGGGWRVFIDPKQNIYQGVELLGMQALMEQHPARFTLQTNCRNTAPIATALAMLSGIDTGEVRPIAGPEVDIIWYADDADQARRLSRHIARLLSDGIKPSEVTVLSRRKLENTAALSELPSVPVKVEKVERLTHFTKQDWGAPSGAERSVRFSTVSGFKGLESDVVLLVDVNELHTPAALTNVYVGASRARSVLGVFLSETARDDYEEMAFRFGAGRVEENLDES